MADLEPEIKRQVESGELPLLGGESQFGATRGSEYGSQDIFRLYSTIAVYTLAEMKRQGRGLRQMIFYAGETRAKVNELQRGSRDKFGAIRSSDKPLQTYLTEQRFRDAEDLFLRAKEEGVPFDELTFFEGTWMLFEDNPLSERQMCTFFDDQQMDLANIEITSDQTFTNQCRGRVDEEFILELCGRYQEDFGPDEEYLQRMYFLDNYIRTPQDSANIARVHWYLALKVPHLRGGGSVAEWVAGGLMVAVGIPFQGWNPAFEPWSQAITSGMDRFVEIYSQLML